MQGLLSISKGKEQWLTGSHTRHEIAGGTGTGLARGLEKELQAKLKLTRRLGSNSTY
jgi:hypothetical protein